MRFLKPSRKVLVFLILMVVLIATTILVSNQQKNNLAPKTKDIPVNLVIKNSLDKQFDPKDSDGDGLPDWQETIWGTDKLNPDTDGDGTSDGAEVNMNRNPLVKGPDDKIISTEKLAQDYTPQTKIDPDSKTTILSKNLLLRIAQAEQSGQYTQDTGDQIAQDLYKQSLELVNIPDKYSEDLFLTFDSNDPKKLEEYRDKLAKIQLDQLPNIQPDNKDLKPLINAYKNVAEEMTTIPVPKDLLKTHAKIANNYYLVAEALINLNISDKDPLLGLLSIPIYQKIAVEQPILFKQIETYLEKNGIMVKKQN